MAVKVAVVHVAELVVHADIGDMTEYGDREDFALDKKQQIAQRGDVLGDGMVDIKDLGAQLLFHMFIL